MTSVVNGENAVMTEGFKYDLQIFIPEISHCQVDELRMTVIWIRQE